MYMYHVLLDHYLDFTYFPLSRVVLIFNITIIVLVFFNHVSVSLFGCKISLSMCNITGAHTT